MKPNASIRTLAIIPARGGSVRVPRKNIKPFLGTPAILRTLTQVHKSQIFDEIHVSTDDDEICELVSAQGFAPRFLRSPRLADNTTPLKDVVRSVVKTYEDLGMQFDFVALIFPTAFFVDSLFLREAYNFFKGLPKGSELLTVMPYPVPVEWAHGMDDSGRLSARNWQALEMRSQDLPVSFFETGEFVFYDHISVLGVDEDKMKFGFQSKGPGLDIDTLEDWAKAEAFARAGYLPSDQSTKAET